MIDVISSHVVVYSNSTVDGTMRGVNMRFSGSPGWHYLTREVMMSQDASLMLKDCMWLQWDLRVPVGVSLYGLMKLAFQRLIQTTGVSDIF